MPGPALPTAPAYNDGSIPYGSRTEAMLRPPSATALGTYIFEQITITRPTNVIRRKNQVNEPTGSVGQNDFVTGSATVQIASSSTKFLLPGDYFTDTFNAEVTAEKFIITSADQPETQADYKKQTIQFIEAYN